MALSENNLRQQKSHLIDEISGQKSNVAFVAKQRDTLLKVCEELKESAEYWSEYDVPLGIVKRLDAAIDSVRGNHAEQPLDMVETTAPALIFYLAGSLGEAVES